MPYRTAVLSQVSSSVVGMAVGQQVLSGDGDLPALERAAEVVEQLERDRRALHGRALRAALDLHAAQCANGMGLGTVAQLALSLDCSELRAGQLLTQAQVLGLLPDALEALDGGLLGVEQAGAFVTLTLVLSDHHRSVVWDRLLERLHSGAPMSPARLREWLARAVRTADPDGAAARRAQVGDVVADRDIDLVADGGTGLYATVRAASASLSKAFDPARINAVVVLTDGRNEFPGDSNIDSLTRELSNEDADRTVRVFPIAYGDDADLGELRRIADASRAAAYDASDPASIDKVLTAVLSNF